MGFCTVDGMFFMRLNDNKYIAVRNNYSEINKLIEIIGL